MQLEQIYLHEAHSEKAYMAAKATTTIRQGMHYQPEHAAWFAANQVLFNQVAAFYFGQWKERKGSSILLKVWTGSCWSWLKVRLTGRELPNKAEAGSPALIQRGGQWWLHTPVEKQFKRPQKIETQVSTDADTRICAVDLNLTEQIAVCTVQTVEGTILATCFIGGGREISGFRKRQLGRIARNRHKT